MRVRVLFSVAAVLMFANITPAIAQEAFIYGIFCDTAEQVEMYILEQQEATLTQGSSGEDHKQDKKHNCTKLDVIAVGMHEVRKLHTFLEQQTVAIFAVRVVAILPNSDRSEPYQRLDDPILVYTPVTLK